MSNILSKYAIQIILAQFALLLLSGYLIYGSYTQWEVETRVETDTTVEVKTDTVWAGFDLGFDITDLKPDTVLKRPQKDTTVKDSVVHITHEPGVRLYNQDFSRTLSSGATISGTITSKVRGELVDQSISITGSIPKITRYRNRTVTEKVTKTQVGKWRVVGSFDTFYGDGKIQTLAPGIGLQRPTQFSLFYKYDFKGGYHGASINFPLSLLF